MLYIMYWHCFQSRFRITYMFLCRFFNNGLQQFVAINNNKCQQILREETFLGNNCVHLLLLNTVVIFRNL